MENIGVLDDETHASAGFGEDSVSAVGLRCAGFLAGGALRFLWRAPASQRVVVAITHGDPSRLYEVRWTVDRWPKLNPDVGF